MNNLNKIIELPELVSKLEKLRKIGKKIVTTNGVFDILHVGHLEALEKSASLGDVLVVLVNSDYSVQTNKGPGRPVVPEKNRARMLAAFEVVDYVCLFGEETPVDCLKEIGPDVHAKGGDYSIETLPEKSIVDEKGGKVVIFNLVSGMEGKISTTSLIEKIKKEF